jgi:tRNA dimethylallyltransferase
MLAAMARRTVCAVVGISKVFLTDKGSTGVGKSQLSIDLARALNGQVINGDSMQVYRGADILTNKVTPDETKGVAHHLLGFLDPLDTYDVFQFERDACQAVLPLEETDLD